MLKSELDALERLFPDRLRVMYCVSTDDGTPSNESESHETESHESPSHQPKSYYQKGHIDMAALQSALAQTHKFGDSNVTGPQVFLCGPPAMEKALVEEGGVLDQVGVERGRVYRF